MATIATLLVKLTADAAQFQREMEKSQTMVGKVAGQMAATGKTLTKAITVPVVGVTAAVGGMVAAFGWKRLTSMDEAEAQLKGLGFAAADVTRISEQVRSAVQGTTMTMAEGTSVAAGALAAGVAEGAELEKYIKRVGNAAVGANRDVGDMAQVFNRVQGMGKLMTKELNMVEMGMPGFAMAMAKSLGVPQEEFRKMVTEGQVSSAQFMAVMDDFAGGMADAYASTWAGMVKNTKANIGILGESLLSGVFAQSKDSIAEFLEMLRSEAVRTWAKETGAKIAETFGKGIEMVKNAIAWWSSLDDRTKKLILTIAGMAVAIGPVLSVGSKLLGLVERIRDAKILLSTKVIPPLISGLQTLWAVMMANPVLAIIAAIAALIAIGVYLYKNWDTVKEKLVAIWELIKAAAESYSINVQRAWAEMQRKILEIVKGILDAVAPLIDWLPDSMKSGFTRLREGVEQQLSLVNDRIDNLRVRSEDNAGRIVSAFGRIVGAAKSAREAVEASHGWDVSGGTQLGAKQRASTTQMVYTPGVGWHQPPSFQSGGVVPGAIGSPQLIMAHGGEVVVPAGHSAGVGNISINVTGNYIANDYDIDEIGERLVEKIRGRLKL